MSQKQKLRNALLAKIHIAKKEMGLDDTVYRIILRDEYGVESAKQLHIDELKGLVSRFESKGWQSKGKGERTKDRGQVEALKDRITQELLTLGVNDKRFRGLVRKVCGVDDVRFCRDAEKLKQVLAILPNLSDRAEA